SDALVHLPSVDNGVVRPTGQLSASILLALRERAPSFSGVAGMGFGGFVVSNGGDPELIGGARISSNGFEVLGVRAALGRTFDAGADSGAAAAVAVISDRLWHRVFGGDSAIIGRIVAFSGVQRRVLGVMPGDFRLPTMEDSEMWIPLDLTAVL